MTYKALEINELADWRLKESVRVLSSILGLKENATVDQIVRSAIGRIRLDSADFEKLGERIDEAKRSYLHAVAHKTHI